MAKTKSKLTRAASQLRRWRESPGAFVRECLRAEPDPWQDGILAAFTSSPRIAVAACKGPGKTATEAWLIWNFLATRPNPKIAATSITGDNLRDNLWAELALWRSRSPFLTEAFEWTRERIYAKDNPENWWASARTWSRDADAEQQANTLAGLHADYVLVVVDESGGIPDAVVAAADGVLATGTEAHVFQAGNPTHLTGPLYRALTTERPLWRVFEITGDPDDPDRAPRVSVQWACDQIQRYGRESSWVQTNVFGRLPKGATDAVVSIQQFEDAFARWEQRSHLAVTPRTLGVDVARFGSDKSVVCFRAGDVVERFVEWHGQDTVYTSARVKELAAEWEAETVYVDDVGVGGGVTDQLQAMDVSVVGVDVGTSATDTTKHINSRSELTQAMQDRFREGLITIAPDIREGTTLMAEGSTLKVGYSTGSRRKVESKGEYRKRTGKSPDYWDAMVLAFADSMAPHAGLMSFMQSRTLSANRPTMEA